MKGRRVFNLPEPAGGVLGGSLMVAPISTDGWKRTGLETAMVVIPTAVCNMHWWNTQYAYSISPMCILHNERFLVMQTARGYLQCAIWTNKIRNTHIYPASMHIAQSEPSRKHCICASVINCICSTVEVLSCFNYQSVFCLLPWRKQLSRLTKCPSCLQYTYHTHQCHDKIDVHHHRLSP